MRNIKTSPYVPTSIEIEELGENSVRIKAFPFEAGYAITLAHPLRRLLLSSSVGYAPIGIKIEGASHEFDSIRGVLEDVALIIVNLKNTRFKFRTDTDSITLDYSFSGPYTITGSDLGNDDVEIVTKEQHLATINEDAELKFSITLYRGIGYVPSEDTRDLIESDFIPMDAYFTPVRKAVYDIENMLVEDDPNYERLLLDITTDGQISPTDAFKDALSVMYKQMSVFNTELNIGNDTKIDIEADSPELKKMLQKVDTLNLSARSFNCLDRSNIKFIGELVLMSENELKDIKNLGKKSFEEIKEKLEEVGFPVGESVDLKLQTQFKKRLETLK